VPYRVEMDEPRGAVRVVVDGIVDAGTARSMVADARAAAGPRNLAILYDFRRAVPGKLTTADVFWFPRSIPALATPEARRVRVAVLHDGSQGALMAFWETSFRNTGLQARAFDDEAQALAWLGERAAP